MDSVLYGLSEVHNGAFQERWLSLTLEANCNASSTLQRSIERLPGNFIISSMTKNIHREGDSRGSFHHASPRTQPKSSTGCSVN